MYRPLVPRAPRIQYRDAGPHTIFPDPLFKEQWYLVSKVCVRFLFFPKRCYQRAVVNVMVVVVVA